MGAGLKHSQQVQIYFWFLLLAFMARKECSQQHFLSVLSFSKHQIWCPSLLGWDGVNCLAKKWGGAKARSAISYILLISTFSLQPTAFWNWCSKHAFIFKILFHFQNVLLFSKFHIFEIVDHALALPPIFCQTANPISTNGAWTPNVLKMNAHFENAVGCIPFLPWRVIKSIFEIVDYALALPPIFCQTVNPISTNGAWPIYECHVTTPSRNRVKSIIQ